MTGALSKRVVIITGGSRGFGRALAIEFCRAGATVALTARTRGGLESVADEARAAGGEAHTFVADVTDAAAMAEACDRIEREIGDADVLVNNAGVSTTFEPFAETDVDAWWETVDINLRGTAIATRRVLPGMLGRGGGRIISITSRAAVHQRPLASAYVVSKAGVVKLMENLAAETLGTGVALFSFDPGILTIGLTETLFSQEPAPGSREEMVTRWFRQQIAGGRSFEAAASAAAVVALASGAADELSGRHLSMYDDLDDVFARASDIAPTDALYLRRLPE